jgi:CheY-like chemotaxis protein
MSRDAAILLVDDEKVVLDSLSGQLSQLYGSRYVYEQAENVAEAWEVIEELHDGGTRILVIVSDWLMPGTRGDDFLVEVRRRHPDIRTVLLTGQADDAAIRRVHEEAQVERVLFKPWSVDDLRETVERALAG